MDDNTLFIAFVAPAFLYFLYAASKVISLLLHSKLKPEYTNLTAAVIALAVSFLIPFIN